MVRCLIIMGVSGSGKTTIGRRLAERVGWRFIEGDDFHSPENIEKMTRGIPLTDEDRNDWLARLQAEILTGEPAIVACSALKGRYRELLAGGKKSVRFIFLSGEFDLILDRLTRRKNHFMGTRMLRSQFADLEIPSTDEAVHIDSARSPEEIVSELALFYF
jgi:gluconokinase